MKPGRLRLRGSIGGSFGRPHSAGICWPVGDYFCLGEINNNSALDSVNKIDVVFSEENVLAWFFLFALEVQGLICDTPHNIPIRKLYPLWTSLHARSVVSSAAQSIPCTNLVISVLKPS